MLPSCELCLNGNTENKWSFFLIALLSIWVKVCIIVILVIGQQAFQSFFFPTTSFPIRPFRINCVFFSKRKERARQKNTQTFLRKQWSSFHIKQNFSLEIENYLYVMRQQQITFTSFKPKSNIFPLNILCVFFNLTLEKEQAR